jgi:ankyrin repeat protein
MSKIELVAAMVIFSILILSCGTKTQNKAKETEFNNEKVLSENEESSFDQTLIFQASLEGNTQIVQNALNEGFDPNTVDENGRTALMLAAYNGNANIVQLLIEKEANVNHTDEMDRTALMYASTGPFVNTVTALLKAGANPNMIDNEENWTAAMMAAAEGQIEVLKTLVSNGADLKMVDIDGESSLDFARANGHSAVVEFIKSNQ